MLEYMYENKNDIPQGAEGFYSEKDGKFTLNVNGVKTQSDVDSLSDALSKERKLRRDAEHKANDSDNKFSFLPSDFNEDQYKKLIDSKGGDIEQRLKEQRESIEKVHKQDLDKLSQALTEKDGLITTHVTNAQLKQAMVENNISKTFMPAVEALLGKSLKVEGMDVYLNEKPLSDAMKEWANSEEGKHYVVAAQNTGGGANNKSNGASAKQMKQSDFDSLSPKEQAVAMSSGTTLTE